MSSFANFFSRDSETKQRIKNFERICFVIYSGKKDYYENKLNLLLEKMSEVIKNCETSHPALLVLVIYLSFITSPLFFPSSLLNQPFHPQISPTPLPDDPFPTHPTPLFPHSSLTPSLTHPCPTSLLSASLPYPSYSLSFFFLLVLTL